MSYRFLPWVRRGLAAEISEPDDPATGLPARATYPVRLKTTAGDASIQLRLYGPGDVVGIDTRSIVRTEPRRGSGNFAPNQFASVDFDPPDFPWMFTPGRANAQDRLRPWLVLVVVAKQEGVSISVGRDRPLPRLTIAPPAVPADELPKLDDSWAWAHAQMVERNGAGDVVSRLKREPDLNVSRLICPRRLEPDREYYGCLVPTFDAGRKVGLGEEGPDATTTSLAWGEGGVVSPTVALPLYYHWEFRTGPAGDFEALARKLTPKALPPGVGTRPMFVGSADRALPQLPATETGGGIVRLEGALRAAKPGAAAELGEEHRPIVAALKSLLDAAAAHVEDGMPTSSALPAENVAPPIYGSWHARTHAVPDEGQPPKWLRDLNVDPRHRAAAGLGTEIVKSNQERYMDTAWEQVGDIVSANQALNLARLIDLVAGRLLDRHFKPLDAAELFSVTAPIHGRTLLGSVPLARAIDRSVMPAGVSDPSFRRRTSPQNNVLKRVARLTPGATTADGNLQRAVIRKLAVNALPVDFDSPVDGLTSSTLIDRLPRARGAIVDGKAIGLSGTVRTSDVKRVAAARDDLASSRPVETVVRPDIAITGLLLDRHVDQVASAGGSDRLLGQTIRDVISRRRTDGDAIAFLIPRRGEVIEALVLEDDRVLRARSATGVTREIATLDPAIAPTLGSEGVRGLIGRLPAGTFDTGRTRPTLTAALLEAGRREAVEPIVPGGGPLTIALDPPVTEREVVADFVNAYRDHAIASRVTVKSSVPAPKAVELPAVAVHLIGTINPHRTIRARAGTRIRVGSSALASLVAPDRLRHDEELGPIMVGPVLPEPLYRRLADYNQDRFLPGAGQIPANSISLLETNPRFVEAFLVGANHEMNRELLWRGFPTDRRGTPFRVFWDRVDGQMDIGPIHMFGRNRRLGSNSAGSMKGSLVLLIRGDLLRRYPNSVVYAAPSRPDRKLDSNPAAVEMPIFGGKLDPDITFVGFALTVEQVSPEPGWFFVIQEQPTEPRFGLDQPNGSASGLATWSDLSWAHAGVAPGGHLSLAAMPASLDLKLGGPGSPNARWNSDAASMAAITFQRPFRVAVHTSDVLAAQITLPEEA